MALIIGLKVPELEPVIDEGTPDQTIPLLSIVSLSSFTARGEALFVVNVNQTHRLYLPFSLPAPSFTASCPDSFLRPGSLVPDL